MMTSLFRNILLISPAVGLVAFMARPVLAGSVPVPTVTLTLDDPNPVLVIPTSGSFVHTFTGTVSFSPGLVWSSSVLNFPYINGGFPGLTGYNINAPYPGAENGGTFVGGLFTYEINSTDLPGFYNEQFGGGPANLVVEALGPTTYSDSLSYTITLVTPTTTTVPESSPILAAPVLIGLLAAAQSYQRRK